MSEARTMILKMLAEGKITVEESERLLSAIRDEAPSSDSGAKKSHGRHERRDESEYREEREERESRSSRRDHDYFDPFINATRLGFDLRNLAHNVQQTVQQAIKKSEPRSREFKDKMKEFGNWMQDMVNTMATEMVQTRGEPADAVSVDFVVPPPKGLEDCVEFVFENVFGEIRVQTGSEFKMRINGRVSQAVLGEYKPAMWFSNYGMRIRDNVLYVGFEKNMSINALLDMEITLPEEAEISCRTVSSDVRIRGRFNVKELKTVSGNIRVMGATLTDSQIETVSGDVQLEGGEISMNIKSTSGDFIVRESVIKQLKINSVSGDILLAEASVTEETDVKLVTTSGDIMVEKISGPWSLIESFTRSGDVILDWTGDASPLNNQGTQLKSGAPGAVFKAESVSGDIQFV